MMIGVTLRIGTFDLSPSLSTYRCSREISWKKVVVTMDNVEHPYPGAEKDVISFGLLPMTDAESAELYNALSPLVFNVTYTSTYDGRDITKRMRITSNLEDEFLLLSIDGKRRYRGGEIQLREL